MALLAILFSLLQISDIPPLQRLFQSQAQYLTPSSTRIYQLQSQLYATNHYHHIKYPLDPLHDLDEVLQHLFHSRRHAEGRKQLSEHANILPIMLISHRRPLHLLLRTPSQS